MSTDHNEDGPERRSRILVSAYAADPRDGSETMVGWQRAVQSARFFDTWLLCAPHESREGIEGYIAKNGEIERLEIVYVSKPRWMEAMEHIPGLYYLSYNLWQRRALRVAEDLDKVVGFDVVHQANMCGYREPGYLWRLDVPFVWGPVGGTQNYPTQLLLHGGIVGAPKEAIRTFLNRITLRWSRRIRHASDHAASMQAANATVARDLKSVLGREKIGVMVEIGAPHITERRLAISNDEPLRILWAGEMLAFKALPQLLEALHDLPQGVEFELTVAGIGQESARWKRLAERLGVSAHIRWLGWVPYSKMAATYAAADVLAFTSLRDTSGSVVLEALASGVPVLGPDHQGVGEMVTDRCGVLVPVTTHKAMVSAYRDAIVDLDGDRAKLASLSEGATKRAEYYAWDRQGERMRDVYNEVVASSKRGSPK